MSRLRSLRIPQAGNYSGLEDLQNSFYQSKIRSFSVQNKKRAQTTASDQSSHDKSFQITKRQNTNGELDKIQRGVIGYKKNIQQQLHLWEKPVPRIEDQIFACELRNNDKIKRDSYLNKSRNLETHLYTIPTPQKCTNKDLKLDNRIEHLFNNTVRVNTDYNLLKFETQLRNYDTFQFKDQEKGFKVLPCKRKLFNNFNKSTQVQYSHQELFDPLLDSRQNFPQYSYKLKRKCYDTLRKIRKGEDGCDKTMSTLQWELSLKSY